MTERDQVTQLVRFIIELYSEVAEWALVVYVKLTTKLLLCCPAHPASVAVSAAGIAPLAAPVRAIVGFGAALPVKAILANIVDTHPLIAASVATEDTAILMRYFDAKHFAALWTGLVNAALSGWSFAIQPGPRLPGRCLGQIIAPATLRTKMSFGLLGSSWASAECLATLLTDQIKRLATSELAQLPFGVSFSRALARAIDSRPTLKVVKLFATSRARLFRVGGGILACSRTVLLGVRGVVLKRLVALGAIGFHVRLILSWFTLYAN